MTPFQQRRRRTAVGRRRSVARRRRRNGPRSEPRGRPLEAIARWSRRLQPFWAQRGDQTENPGVEVIITRFVHLNNEAPQVNCIH
jgi:hypothetical protein